MSSEQAAPGRLAAAFFDVDGTLLDATIIRYYLYFLRHRPPKLLWPLRWTWLCLRLPYYALLDRADRGRFNAAFYRNYRGFRVDLARDLAAGCFQQVIAPRLRPGAAAVLDQHRQNNHRLVLLTGSLDVLMQPLAESLRVDHLDATTLRSVQGIWTGEIAGPPMDGPRKRELALAYATREGIDMASCYAYADSLSDLQLLEAVGHPVAVNPDRRLRKVAGERGWRVVDWSRSDRGD